MPDDLKTTEERRRLIETVAHNPAARVQVAVADIEGILRGKYLHASRFPAAADRGIGFNVFGTDQAKGVQYTFPGSAILLSAPVQVFPIGLVCGINHEKLRFRYNGADRRLTDVHGEVIHDVLA